MSSLTMDMGRAPSVMTQTGSYARPRPTGLVIDPLLLGSTLLLLALGLVLVYSSSSVFAARNYGDPEHFLSRQLLYAALGIGGMLVAARYPGDKLMQKAPWLFAAAVVACGLVLIPGVGRLVGGARRWLSLGFIGFQPSELCKLAVALVLALVLARRDRRPAEDRPTLLVPVLLVQAPVLLILSEPDLGTALVIELMLLTLVFCAGVRTRTVVVLALAGLPVLYHLVVGTPFRLQRLLSYIDPWAYRSTVGYQITESLISIGSGGVFGVGLGGGKHKLFFLPEAHTDFIFAIVAEELGLVGVLVIVLGFAAFIWSGVGIAVRARNAFDAYLAMGLLALVGIPAVFNVAVATGLLPTKGLPLPFVSYGGTNLMVALLAVGLLMRVGRDGSRSAVEAAAAPAAKGAQ